MALRLHSLNKKPLGQLEVNWSNPLTRGLVGCFVFNEQGNSITNLVDGKRFSLSSGVTRKIAHGESYLSFDGTSNAYIDTFNIDLSLGFTVYGTQRYNSSSVDQAFCGFGDTAAAAGHLQLWRDEFSTDRFGIGYYTTSWQIGYSGSPTPDESTVFGIGSSYDGTDIRLFVNGNQEYGAAATLSSASQIFRIGAANTSGSKNHNGEIGVIYLFNRALNSEHEIASLDRDLYQLVKPKQKLFAVNTATTEITSTATPQYAESNFQLSAFGEASGGADPSGLLRLMTNSNQFNGGTL